MVKSSLIYGNAAIEGPMKDKIKIGRGRKSEERWKIMSVRGILVRCSAVWCASSVNKFDGF